MKAVYFQLVESLVMMGYCFNSLACKKMMQMMSLTSIFYGSNIELMSCSLGIAGHVWSE